MGGHPQCQHLEVEWEMLVVQRKESDAHWKTFKGASHMRHVTHGMATQGLRLEGPHPSIIWYQEIHMWSLQDINSSLSVLSRAMPERKGVDG